MYTKFTVKELIAMYRKYRQYADDNRIASIKCEHIALELQSRGITKEYVFDRIPEMNIDHDFFC